LNPPIARLATDLELFHVNFSFQQHFGFDNQVGTECNLNSESFVRGNLLPRQSDSPEHPGTLPLPELNPLLNPILSKNIGRWAEVYFTNPPEQREAAVAQLIRDLESEHPSDELDHAGPVHSLRREDWTIRTSPTVRHADASTRVNGTSGEDVSATIDAEDEAIACPACRYMNRRRYKFCGRCGARLDAPAASEPAVDFSPMPPRPEPIFGRDLNFHSEPTSYRGLYIGIALVIAAFAVAYFAWTSVWAKKMASAGIHPAQPTAAAAPNDAAPTSSSASSSANGETNSARPAGDASDAASTREGAAEPETPATPEKANVSAPVAAASAPVAPAPARTARPTFTPSTASAATANPSNASSTPSADVQPAAVSQGGFEELAVARHYLNATGGEPNRAEAARWLWKSVAKQNIDATVILSDMYLRGDGVAKSCEQARLLLDAAAIKGRKDAAEQLRHLGAFGCQ
jgi:hypothetical protein